MPNYVAALANLLNTQANTADVQALTQERLANAVLIRSQIDTQNRLREAFANQAINQPSADGSPAQPDATGGGMFDMNDPLAVSYSAVQKDLSNNSRLAKVYQSAGAFDKAEQYDKMVQTGQTNLREIVSKIYDKQQSTLKDAAQVLQGVAYNPTQQSLEGAVRYLSDNFPKPVVQRLLSQIPFDDKGNPIMDDRAMKAINNLNAQYTTAHEKASQQQQINNEVQRQNQAAQAHQDRITAINHADARAAARRAGAQGAAAGSHTAYEDLSDADQRSLDLQSWNYINKNVLPYRKGTGGGLDKNQAILDNVGRIASNLGMSGQELSGSSADFKANAQSLYFQTKKVDAIESQLSSFHNNINTWDSFAKGVAPQIGGDRVKEISNELGKINFVGIKSIDEMKLRIQQEVNDPTVAAYMTSAMAVAMDYARIMQGPQSIASLTEGSRKDAQHLISAGLSPDARKATIAALESDAQGQVKGLKDQLVKIKLRMNMPVSARDKAPDLDLSKQVEAAGQKYEPEKYEYRISPDGKVQRRAK